MNRETGNDQNNLADLTWPSPHTFHIHIIMIKLAFPQKVKNVPLDNLLVQFPILRDIEKYHVIVLIENEKNFDKD